MTISVPNQLVYSSNGDGATSQFSYPVRILEAGELVVLRRENDVDTTLALNTDYTLSGIGDAGGVTITMLSVPIAGQKIVRYRATAPKQIVDLKDKQTNPAEAVEQQLDRLAMVSQDHEDAIERAVKLPVGNTTDTEGLAESLLRLADSADEIDTVAGISADVTTVAGVATDVTTVAGVVDSIPAVAGVADDIPTVAAAAGDISTVATNVADITNFSDVYLGAKATEPTTRNDGSALQAGDQYFDTTNDKLKIYTGSAWVGGTGDMVFAEDVLDEDDMASDSATKVPTQQSVKAFASDPSNQIWAQSVTGAVARTVRVKLEDIKSVLDFGAVGDCTGASTGTDDSAAIQLALDWLVAGNARKIVFPAGKRFRLSSTTTADFAGKWGGQIEMLSPITPDPGIGNGIEIINTFQGKYLLWVMQGGQDAAYSQADPAGGDQAFFVRGVRNAYFDFVGWHFLGRIARFTKEQAGEQKTSNITIGYINVEANITGQALYVDCTSSFGSIGHMWDYYCHYGSIFEDTSDITIQHLAGGYQGGNGLIFKGGASIWLGVLDIGNVTGVNDTNLVTFQDNVSGIFNVHVDKIFAIHGNNGVTCLNVGWDGATARSGITIGAIFTSDCEATGLSVSGSTGVDITHYSYDDQVSTTIGGAGSQNSRYTLHSEKARTSALQTGSIGDGIVIDGSVNDPNSSAAANTSAVDIGSTNEMTFRDFCISADAVDYMYDLASGSNKVRILGGDVTGSSPVFSTNLPKRVRDLSGFKTEASGNATLASGATSVAVTHGLAGTPSVAFAASHNSAVGGVATQSYGATTFTVIVAASVGADTAVSWSAKLACADG